MRISDWSSDVCSSDLKRIERVIDANGNEKVTIRFILDDGHVEEIEANRRKKRLQLAQDAVRRRRRDEGFDDDQIKVRRVFAAEIGRASCRERVCQYV